jgi:transcriptional/translational regulatory protein YebC/TACO1
MKDQKTIEIIVKAVCYTIIGAAGVLILVDTLTNGANI